MLSNLGPSERQALGFQGPENIQKLFQAVWLNLISLVYTQKQYFASSYALVNIQIV